MPMRFGDALLLEEICVYQRFGITLQIKNHELHQFVIPYHIPHESE